MSAAHRQRICTGLALLLPPILGLAMGGLVLQAVLALFCCLGMWEFLSMFWPESKQRLKLIGVACALVVLAAFISRQPVLMALALLAAFWTANLHFLFAFGKSPGDATFREAMILQSGLFYLPVTLHFLALFSRPEIILVLLAAAASDTLAFYAGSHFGRHKVWPQVSPKKSWEGCAGGALGCMAACGAFGLAFGSASPAVFIALGLVLNIAAQFGDFFESALKRRLGVKDSGTLLPGHGGILDRIDSLLFVVPTYALAREFIPFFS